MTHPIRIEPAYNRLTTSERAIVDLLVNHMQATAHLKQERISAVLDRDWQVPEGLIDDEARAVLQRPFVTAALHERISALSSQQDLSVEWWLGEVMNVASSDISDFFSVQVNALTGERELLPDMTRVDPGKWKAVKSLEIEMPAASMDGARGRTKYKIQFWDKMAALDRIGRFIGAADADNPYWAQRGPGMTQAPQVAADASVEDAGEAYSRMLGDG